MIRDFLDVFSPLDRLMIGAMVVLAAIFFAALLLYGYPSCPS